MYCLRWGLCMKMQICKAHTEIASHHRLYRPLHPLTFVRYSVRSLIYNIAPICDPTRARTLSFISFAKQMGNIIVERAPHSTAQRVQACMCVFTSFIIASDFKELMLASSRSLSLHLSLSRSFPFPPFVLLSSLL